MSTLPDTDPVPGAAAMREADRRTIELGIPGAVLMETAGRAVADALVARFGAPATRSVVVACGAGNNGGDGFVAARVLHARGARVHVLLAGDPARLGPDAARYWAVVNELARGSDGRLTVSLDGSPAGLASLPPCGVIVDALLGTGQARRVRAPLDTVVAWINRSGSPVVSVDLPTGIDTDTGEELGEAVRADFTVTMAAPKPGLFLARGPACAGEVVVAEIGIPAGVLFAETRSRGGAFRTTDRAVRRLLAGVPREGHKFASGPAFVAGGSLRYAGAPVLAARAAARAGSGYVVCCAPDAAAPAIAPSLLEIPFAGLPSSRDGHAGGAAAAAAFLETAVRARSILLGPGLGRGRSVRPFVRTVLAAWTGPLVLDADGLNAVDADFMALHAGGRWILTPHAAEFVRLGGDSSGSPVAAAARAAAAWNAVVLLKGYPSVVADPGGPVYVCATGNPALATAGTGDVLGGLCAGLLARGLAPIEAAVSAVHLGGAAADRYAARAGRSSMMASDLLRELGPVLRERFE